MPNTLWTPSNSFIESSNLKHYEKWLSTHYNVEFTDSEELWNWSIESLDTFWESILEYFQIQYSGSYDQVFTQDNMPHVKWFEGVHLNYAEHIFRHYDANNDALIFINERGQQNVSWEDLKSKVTQLRTHLKMQGVVKGDRVVAYLPNIPEAIVSFLAVNSLGAIWSCCSPDFGVDTVIERFSQIDAKVFIACDGYEYNGKPFNKEAQSNEILSKLTSVKHAILINYLDENTIDGFTSWNKIMASEQEGILSFERVEFSHPIWVLYSSGTTGKPKAITHSHGGVLLEHLKYMSLHNDVKPGENFFWFTTTGWMMWNFLQASMLVGATPVLFDGSPSKPNLEILWEWAEKLPIHHFGTSAPYLTACMKAGLSIGENYNMSSLRSIGSTGAPLPPEVFEWIYEAISSDIWLCSMSGGTDVCTAFVGGHPYKQVEKGKIQSRALGCALFAYDDQANRVEESLGEMVIEQPMPSMPIYFWNDEGYERYTKSYFENFPGKWRHGDWIKLWPDGSLMIHGRSDSTLNRKGIRIGTAEIYNALDKISEIEDALIINIEQDNGEDIMPLFVKMNSNEDLSDDLKKKINTLLKKDCSPRHVPDMIILVPDIPYTLSGKKMEVPVKRILMGMNMSETMNKDAIRNPDAIDWFINEGLSSINTTQ